jgi:hypothetical protein
MEESALQHSLPEILPLGQPHTGSNGISGPQQA